MSVSTYSGTALKRSALHFLTGKAASALLTFLILLWIVRLLPVVEYGAYVTLIAGMELALIIATLGLPWLAARYLPEYRLHAPGPKIRHLVLRLFTWQAASLAGVAAILVIGLGPYLKWAGLTPYRTAAQFYLLVLLVEGNGRQVRESLLGPLLLQGVAQISLVARNLAFIALLAMATMAGPVSLIDVVHAELAASVLGTALSLLGLVRRLMGFDALPGKPGWHEPRLSDMWRIAGNMYFSHLLTLFYSPQVYLLLIQRYLGVEATAIFGFLRTLYDQIARYLPATLLFGLVRPKLVASYVDSGNVEELSRNANLAGKLSLFVLMPLVAFIAVEGQDLIGLLSGAKFPETGLLFLGFMLALIPFSQRQLLETVAVVVGHSQLCTYAAASGILMLPLMYGLLVSGLGLWAPVIALGLGHLVVNGLILSSIVRHTGYKPDTPGFSKLLAAALAAALAGIMARAWILAIQPVWIRLMVAALLTTTIFLLVAWWIKPFAEKERARLNVLLNRRLFVW
jgi:O-antigen/teichoic acid export membrane protein